MIAFLLLSLVAAASAAPQNFVQDFNSQNQFNNQQFTSDQFVSDGQQVRVLNQKFAEDPLQNTFEYTYELDNGVKAEQRGNVQPGPEPETGVLTQQGSYSFTGDDGNTYTVTYVANDGGFQPQGAHLPVAPAQIPEYAQLRNDHPELFWAETGGAGIIQNDQFNNQQFVDNQQFVGQSFGNNQFIN